ncbi:hypothetical protein R5R35_012087 [Gryllus longicercus]|uniref:Uncharacterized protein n=1 Tax=Gryllus longicercus TaxID=2509291 RepID=A0AAN9WHA3_9ORTH
MVDASLGGTINTSANVGLSVSSNSESSTFPITVVKPHFENEMKTNYKLVEVGKAESLTDTKGGETLKMVCTNGNIAKTGTVNKVDVSGRDSVGNFRKRALATELNDLCKTAKVTEETGAFDLSVSHDSMHEGKLDIDLEATKKYKEQYVSSVLHNNPFGSIHTLCNNNTKISDDIGKYCHQKNIETCNACNMHNLQMHGGSGLNANSSQESILQKRVRTEAQIAEIIKGISLLKLCSKLKTIHQVNRNVSKISASECFPAFSIDTHCAANMGIVFPSTSKYRNKITCHSGFNANVRACSIDKNVIFSVDEHDMSPSFSERKSNEKVIGTLKPFTCEIVVRAENEVEAENTPQEINISDERNALLKKCFVNKNENSRVSNAFVNKNLPRECVIKCEFNTDCYSEQNQERNINSGKELNKCSAKEVIIARSEKMIHISEPSREKCSEVVQCTLSAPEYMSHESSTCEMGQQKVKEDLHLNSTNGIFYSEIRNSGAVKGDCDDNISEHFAKPDAKSRVLQIKDNTSVISKWGFERVSQKQESMSKDEVMPFVTSRIDVKICDISRLQIGDSDSTKNNISDSCILRNDTMNTKDICKSNLLKKSKELFGSSPIKHVCSTPNEKHLCTSDKVHENNDDPMSTLEIMEINYDMNKNDEDKMSNTHTLKNLDANDLVYKSDIDDIFHIGSRVNGMDATDVVYKSDEDDEMHVGSSVKDMDTNDSVHKSDEDEVMHIGSTAKNMDTTDVVYKNDEDEVMHIGSTVKDMDATDLVYKSDEDDVMHIGSTAKNMDTTDVVYKSDEDDVMCIGSNVKDMDATDLVYKSDEDDVMHIESTAKDMDTTDTVYKSDDDVMHIRSNVKDMDATDLVYKSEEDDVMHIRSTVKDMDATDLVYKSDEDVMHIGSTAKDMDTTDTVYKSDEDDVMHIRSNVKDMDATDLMYKSDDDNDDGMSVVSSIKYMDIDIRNKRSEGNIGDTSKIKAMHRSKDRRKGRKGEIDISDVDNLVSIVNDCVSTKDAFNPGFNKHVCDNLSMAVEANESNMISGGVKDVIDSDSWDQEHEMLSVMSADAFEDDCSLCSMKDVMSEGSVVELTDIHCYRHVDVCSDSDTDTLRDGSESNDDHTASYEETSDATSLNETITSDYIEKDVNDSSRCGDDDEIEEEEEENDNDGDDFDCDYFSCSEYDTGSCERDRDVMSCSSGQETSDEVMSLTSNGDDEMNELSTY